MREVETIEAFEAWADAGPLEPAAVQALDLSSHTERLCRLDAPGSLFLACQMDPRAAGRLVEHGAIVVPEMPGAYTVHRARLYAPEELYDAFDPRVPGSFEASLDQRIYRQYLAEGRDRPASLAVGFQRALHDQSITAALDELLQGRRVVAIMGGHAVERASAVYREVARLAKALSEQSFLVVSGGGPGAMEASHLGAWLAGRPAETLDEVLGSDFTRRPAGAPPGREYADPCWLARAWRVREAWPRVTDQPSVGIPTWLYGHEPPTPFASHIAKYFANAIREEGLLAIAHHGVVFAPGSAGTTQEIFQDACQNHYGTQGLISPMILMGRTFWTEQRPVWPLLERVARGQTYGELLTLVDTADEALRAIHAFEPSWYRVTEDPDAALEARWRRTMGLRSNFVFERAWVARAGEAGADAAAALVRLGVAGPVVGPVEVSEVADWIYAIATDNWVARERVDRAMAALVDRRVYRGGDAFVFVSDARASAWRLRLED